MSRLPKASPKRSAKVSGATVPPRRHFSTERWRVAAVVALLVLAVIAIYARARNNAFVNYDDDVYVYNNDSVKNGLTLPGLVWDFTTTDQSNWHPLTWLTHQADCQVYGVWAGGAHQTNFLLHAANASLVFLILYALTGSLWRCAFAAAFFALHPLRVESVAWAAERKDVLSSLFWLLATAAYIGYARRPSAGRMALAVLIMAAGLMAKPTLVTFPFTLLLLDYWPLGRCTFGPPPVRPDVKAAPVSWRRLIGEKTPLFILAAISSLITMHVQRQSLAAVPFYYRLPNAVRAYSLYLWNTIIPRHLAVIYTFDPFWMDKYLLPMAVLSAVSLISLTIVILRYARRAPYLAFGWLWYLGTLVPMIGLVEVGSQSRADRYTYIPSIGLGIALAWGGWALATRLRLKRRVVAAVAIGLCVAWAGLAWRQVGFWRNSIVLFQHVLNVTSPDNEVALEHLGKALYDVNRLDDALACDQQLWRFVSNSNSIAGVDEGPGAVDLSHQAQIVFRRKPAVAAELLAAMSQCNAKLGHVDQAIRLCREAVVLDPYNIKAHCNLGAGYCQTGRPQEGIKELKKAIAIDPLYDLAQINLGMAYFYQNQDAEAMKCFAAAVKINDKDPDALGGLGSVYLKQKRFAEAIPLLQSALQQRPGDPQLQKELQLARQGQK